jgi:hypothetical protein
VNSDLEEAIEDIANNEEELKERPSRVEVINEVPALGEAMEVKSDHQSADQNAKEEVLSEQAKPSEENLEFDEEPKLIASQEVVVNAEHVENTEIAQNLEHEQNMELA